MASTKQRQQQAQQARRQAREESRQLSIKPVITMANLANDHGVQLTEENIFAAEDAYVYEGLAQRYLTAGVKIEQIWALQDQHDDQVKTKYGVDLSKFNGDISLYGNYDPLAQALNQLPVVERLVTAIISGVLGYYTCHGHNSHVDVDFVNFI